ncbi:tRNA 4-thiouridine(8) synthase ThiI [Aerococcaceae bacterium INB8]|uniref:Probable tRNA sulfurtransferase n=1 Tax=Ruoffia halotolerans TaxID=2748684 RepID=A0A839A9G9_9LACT|nr:tRNA uracil 4-sulfurtransferase ThiI [Ruoffia halotolerans]MBA5730165.1 tRNA 4-thiouridine(8) synthase ThiI [Ruoffia halotolerans]
MEEKQIKIHYGELSTKGKNRKMFQQKMAEQIRHKTKHIERIKIFPNRDFMFIKWEQARYEELIEVLKDIPGISRFEPVYPVAKDMDAIKKRALELFSELNIQDGESFKVVAKRSDKEFELDTYEIQREVGDVIGEVYQNLAVKMTRPTYKLTVSIHLKDEAYLSLLSYQGLQGMPYGSSGRGMLMLSGGFDSPIAGYLMMRRGMEIEAVHFSSPPYTSPQALEKAKKLTAKLAHFGMPIKFHNVPFAKIQEEIKAHVPDSESMTVMRRFMLRIMDQLIERNNADAIVNGESLGQVASQTIKSMRVINEVTSTPIFRPLIATDKNEIINLAEKIDTFDISNEPYEDCCTVFAPTAPHTKPKQEKIEDYESALDIEGLVKDAIENTHIEKIDEDYIRKQEADFADLL